MDTIICDTSLKQSKMRKRSMPRLAASVTNSSTTLSGYEVYPTALAPRTRTCDEEARRRRYVTKVGEGEDS
jgi:hypothetical protein